VATCVRCRASAWGLKAATCLYCSAPGCERCLFAFGRATNPRGYQVPVRACSWACFDRWASYYVSHGQALRPWGASWALAGVTLEPTAASRALLFQARQYELAERLEEAARTYETVGMAKEAGELRRRAKRTVVTQVQMDVNALVEQVRRGGLATSYACPACRSPIPITAQTSAESLRACGYCGATIQTTDLVAFLSRVVGA